MIIGYAPADKSFENMSAKPRSIAAIAADIKADWSKLGKGVNYAAKPYLDAMFSLGSASDSYGCDSASEVVIYFLANANSYRGEKAKALKAELKALFPAIYKGGK